MQQLVAEGGRASREVRGKLGEPGPNLVVRVGYVVSRVSPVWQRDGPSCKSSYGCRDSLSRRLFSATSKARLYEIIARAGSYTPGAIIPASSGRVSVSVSIGRRWRNLKWRRRVISTSGRQAVWVNWLRMRKCQNMFERLYK